MHIANLDKFWHNIDIYVKKEANASFFTRLLSAMAATRVGQSPAPTGKPTLGQTADSRTNRPQKTADDIKQLPYLIYSGYSTVMVIRSCFMSTKLYAEKHSK